ncbi:MAG TPA: histidine kinase [Saprospiraceae bacterium]|nr:histidine kinase [Saprospiraceae bacterium]HMQ85496.1 histidine kinase [Saprospiraceae bacterium]
MSTRKASARDLLGFDDTWLLLLGIPIISFSVPLLFFNASLSAGIIAYLPKWGISILHTVCYWSVTRSVMLYFRRRYQGYDLTKIRLVYGYATLIAAFFAVNYLTDFIMGCVPHTPPEVTHFLMRVSSLTIVILVSVVYESIYFYDLWRQTILETEKLKRENIESQLESLKAQVSPHFLFNSLNTLTYIIPENADRAVRFVQKLSKVYRYILEIRDKKLISLQEEMEFLDAYLFLLRERFGDNLRVNLQIPGEYLTHYMAPLSLQILFENAIKHNIISGDKPLEITVWVENKRLVVRNKLQRKKQNMPSTKFGLQNISNRYAYLCDEQVDVLESSEYFSVSLPLIGAPAKIAGE